MAGVLIKQSAVRPLERVQYIAAGDSGGDSIVKKLISDPCAHAFGLKGLSNQPHEAPALVLPQAKLSYGYGNILDPGLSGSWNIDRFVYNYNNNYYLILLLFYF